MGRIFQPYEAHIPYGLQVFIDQNLFGMGFINLSSVKFRYPLPKSRSIASGGGSGSGSIQYDVANREASSISVTGVINLNHFGGGGSFYVSLTNSNTLGNQAGILLKSWLASNVDPQDMSKIPKISKCELELDAKAECEFPAK